MTTISLVSASFLNGTLVLFCQKRFYLQRKMHEKQETGTSAFLNRLPPTQSRKSEQAVVCGPQLLAGGKNRTGTSCTHVVQIIILVKQSHYQN